MPADWIVVAAGVALKAVVGPAVSGVGKVAARKIGNALSDGPLEKPLKKAFTEAFTGFYKTLDAALVFTVSGEENLSRLPESEAFQGVAGQLPHIPFTKIDPAPLRKAFLALQIEGAHESNFDAAWQAFGQRFQRAVAQDADLKRYVDLSANTRQEEREETLLSLVAQLVDAHEKAAKAPDHEPALRAYSDALYRQYRYADTRGLFMREKEGVGEGIELRDVFVETALAPIRIERKKEPDEAEAKRSPRWHRDPMEEAQPTEAALLGQILERERLIVVLGSPGSGKSTLLRCLALTLCRPDGANPLLEHSLPPDTVPVLLPLKEYASKLRTHDIEQLERFLLERFETEISNLAQLLQEGRALVLLDGLDEVFDEAHRRWVSDQVWALTARYDRSRFLLTSRPHGYEAAPLPGPVARWRLLPFDDDQIGRFFLGWFQSIAREGGEAGSEETPEERATDLTKEVLARERLKEMAQNPLLCTLIVLVHRSRSGRLPERRVVFFEAAVRTFAEVWERAKRSTTQSDKYELPEPEILIRALAEVAWRAFHELGSREIPGAALRRWLQEHLEREPEWKGEKGRRAVTDFLRLVGDRTGLLVDAGGDQYQFVHLSLHEWLVSSYLLDRLTEEQRWEVVRYYLHAPEWEEALRLLIGGAPQAQADLLFSRILAEPTSDLEPALQRDLRFLCRCVGDQAPVGPDIRERLTMRALAALDEPELLDVKELLRGLAEIGPSLVLSNILLSWFSDADRARRDGALAYFAQVEGDGEEARRAVLALLEAGPADARISALSHLAQVGANDEKTRRAALAMLGDLTGAVRRSALIYFAQVEADDEETRGAVLAMLGDADWHVRDAAVSYFAQVGADVEEVRRTFLALLSDRNENMRRSAVSYFAQIGADDEEIRRTLRTMMGSERMSVRSSVVSYFAQVGADDEETRRVVLTMLGVEDGDARRSAVSYLAQVGADDEETRRVCLMLLGDEDEDVRRSAVSFFARVGADDEETRRAFLVMLGDEGREARRSAVSYFARVEADDGETRQALLAMLGDEDVTVRSLAVAYFAGVGADDKETYRAFLALLGDESAYVRALAVAYLAQARAVDEETRRAVMKLSHSESQEARVAALGYFLRVGLSSDLVDRLWDLYRDVASLTSGEDDRRVAEVLGTRMAEDEVLRDRILSESQSMPYFRLPLLQSLALEQDRLRRQSNPLRLS